MSVSDITKAVLSNEIKNGASLLLLNKPGIEVLFDNSRDTEQGLDVFIDLTENRFDDVAYYIPITTPS